VVLTSRDRLWSGNPGAAVFAECLGAWMMKGGGGREGKGGYGEEGDKERGSETHRSGVRLSLKRFILNWWWENERENGGKE
jgi:hypothetical protein